MAKVAKAGLYQNAQSVSYLPLTLIFKMKISSCSPNIGASSFVFFSDRSLICISYSIKPTLKKVSKYENKFAKLQKKAAEFNFRNQLKTVKKKEFALEEDDRDHEVL